jgi:O-antigen/teichoic acid export membrane protein
VNDEVTNVKEISEKTTSKKKKPKENLKQRAYLNSLTSIIDYGGAQITGFIVSPIIVNGLGSSFYGVWQMLMQMTGFANMADTRATQVLKWSIANKRDVAAEEELRRDVSTALIVTGFILPIILVVGGLISWYAPYITKLDPQYDSLIRITCSLMILSLVIHKVFDVLESVLRGMNLGYKRMGFRAGIVVMAGVLKVAVIYLGYGIIGLSLVQVFVALVTGITFYYIVKKVVPWFGFGKTNFKNVIGYSKLSGWFMASTGAKMIMSSSDKIILGYLAGPILVTQYTLTIFAAAAIEGIVHAVINGIIPGVGGLFGNGEFDKVQKARRVMFSMNWLFIVSFGVAVLVLNKSFISLWTGDDHYAGYVENFLIILISVQAMFFKTDSVLINVTLNLKTKVMTMLVSSAITVGLAMMVVGEWGIIGLCLSIIAGRMVMSIGFPLILKRKIQDNGSFFQLNVIQPLLAAGVLLSAATYGAQFIRVDNWFYLLGSGALIAVVTGGVFWVIGLTGLQKREVWELISRVKYFKKD